MGLIIPEQYGGTGMTLCELVVLLEEFGRALVPGPFISTVVLGAMPIMEAGTDEQKRQFLPKIASGELIMTMALTEPSAKWSADGVQLEAKKDGSDYVLNGTKLFVPDAHVSDYMVVVARTGGKRRGRHHAVHRRLEVAGHQVRAAEDDRRGQAVRGDVREREGARGQRPGRGGQGLADRREDEEGRRRSRPAPTWSASRRWTST